MKPLFGKSAIEKANNSEYAQNPYFPRKIQSQEKGGFLMVWWVGILLFLGSFYFFFFTDFFQITDFHIQGNKVISTEQISNEMQALLKEHRLKIFTRQNFWLFSTTYANAKIAQRVESDRAIVEISTKKKFPRAVTISVVERIPSLIIQSGGQFAFSDRDGIITHLISPSDARVEFPLVEDENNRVISKGMRMMRPDIIEWLFELHELIPKKAGLTIDRYVIPKISCTEKIIVKEEYSESELKEQVKSDEEIEHIQEKLRAGEISITESIEMIQNLKPKSNNEPKNDESDEKKRVRYATKREPATCDYIGIINELRIKTKEGPALYLDHQHSLYDQLSNLQTLISEKKERLPFIEYIDLRFEDRVYIKEKGG